MTTRIEANAEIKAEMKSFEMCVNVLISMASLPKVKKYLSEREITVSYLKEKNEDKSLVCKKELMKHCKLHEFKNPKTGVVYKAICRKGKDGKIEEAKWSVWAVLCAIDKMYTAKKEAKTIREAIEGKKAIAKAEAKAEQKEAKREEVRAEGKAKRTSAASIKAAQNKARGNKKAA